MTGPLFAKDKISRTERKAAKEAEAIEINKIIATTSDINKQYTIIGIVSTTSVFDNIRFLTKKIKGSLFGLKKMAKELGADAVVGVKYSNVGVEYDRENNSNRSYFVIYGTAVKFIN